MVAADAASFTLGDLRLQDQFFGISRRIANPMSGIAPPLSPDTPRGGKSKSTGFMIERRAFLRGEGTASEFPGGIRDYKKCLKMDI